MAPIRVTADRTINASPEDVYRLIADYRDHHPKFLPPAFADVRVEEGGVGAGTVVTFALTVGGKRRAYRQRVSEPEPGRVLTETDIATGAATSFTVTPEGSGSRVEIATEFEGAGGITGFFERLLAPRLLKRMYVDELARLDDYATSPAQV